MVSVLNEKGQKIEITDEVPIPIDQLARWAYGVTGYMVGNWEDGEVRCPICSVRSRIIPFDDPPHNPNCIIQVYKRELDRLYNEYHED